MRTKLAILIAVAPLAAAALGCGATVHSSFAPGANVQQYKTFSFQRPQSPAARPASIADQEIEDALRQSLIAKGYVESTDGNPDFVVVHHVMLQQRTQVDRVGTGWYGFGGTVSTYSYTEGTVIVDFVDPKTNQAFWRGTAADVVNRPASPNPAKIRAAVTKLINRYPSNVAAIPRTNL
ncbi:MAG TPA: DUF4136 domain-containing protein [Polyangia bacterium]|nr:DUF4136 domain-containing protein [Polyangia bacterium]